MEEKKLTDEELDGLIKKLEYQSWAQNFFELSQAAYMLKQQKAEIERLTEEIDKRREMMHSMDCNYATELQKNAELQKQVDELKESANGHLLTSLYKKQADDHKRAISVQRTHYEKKVQQAVKDTAKEILTEIDDLTLCIIGGSNEFEKGYFQAITDMKTAIKDLLKEKYGA